MLTADWISRRVGFVLCLCVYSASFAAFFFSFVAIMHRIHSKYRKPRAHMTANRKAQLQIARETRTASVDKPSTSAAVQGPSQPQPQSSSTSSKKLELFQEEKSENPPSVNEEDYFIIHRNVLNDLVESVKCDNCGAPNLSIDSQNIQGFARTLSLKCEGCGHVYKNVSSSPRIVEQGNRRPAFEVNRRLVGAFAYMGTGHASMVTLGKEVGMSVLSVRGYHQNLKKIEEEHVEIKEKMLQKTHKLIRELNNKESEEVMDMAVSFDGTWQKRGHTSLNGAAYVIDLETGLVLDFIVLSKYCNMCAIKANSCDVESAEYQEWLKNHKESGECQINYEGSSGAMEKTAAEHLWLRSLSKWKMRYVDLLSDGDASTFDHLCKLDPYDGVSIKKEECINHMAKRLGTALRELVKKESAQGVTLGGRGEGTLKDSTINKLQNYYRNAVVDNIPDVPLIQKRILATLDHCSSTDRKPKHKKCPEAGTPKSWCFYNNAKAAKEKPRSHTEMSLKLSDLVVKKVQPIYARLSSESLLERCSRAGTQNANESLHSILWRKCPKEVFASRHRIEVAATQAASEFNMGYKGFLELRRDADGVSATAIAAAESLDARRLGQSGHQKERTRKRALRKQEKTAAAKTKKTDYKAGGF